MYITCYLAARFPVYLLPDFLFPCVLAVSGSIARALVVGQKKKAAGDSHLRLNKWEYRLMVWFESTGLQLEAPLLEACYATCQDSNTTFPAPHAK